MQPGRSTYRIGEIPSGTWFTWMTVSVKNGSDVPLELRTAGLVGLDGDGAIRVHRTELGVRNDDGSLSGTAPGGFYRSRPPALQLQGGGCAVQTLATANGAVLEPGAFALLAFVVEAADPGRVHASGVRITYTAEGEVYSQLLPIALEAEVVAEGQMRPLPPGGRGCDDEIEEGRVAILPGWPTST